MNNINTLTPLPVKEVNQGRNNEVFANAILNMGRDLDSLMGYSLALKRLSMGSSLAGHGTAGNLAKWASPTSVGDGPVDNSTNWNLAYVHKTTEDAINGLVKCNGAGSYSAVADNSANWNAAYGWGNWNAGAMTANNIPYFNGTNLVDGPLARDSATQLHYTGASLGVYGNGAGHGILSLSASEYLGDGSGAWLQLSGSLETAKGSARLSSGTVAGGNLYLSTAGVDQLTISQAGAISVAGSLFTHTALGYDILAGGDTNYYTRIGGGSAINDANGSYLSLKGGGVVDAVLLATTNYAGAILDLRNGANDLKMDNGGGLTLQSANASTNNMDFEVKSVDPINSVNVATCTIGLSNHGRLLKAFQYGLTGAPTVCGISMAGLSRITSSLGQFLIDNQDNSPISIGVNGAIGLNVNQYGAWIGSNVATSGAVFQATSANQWFLLDDTWGYRVIGAAALSNVRFSVDLEDTTSMAANVGSGIIIRGKYKGDGSQARFGGISWLKETATEAARNAYCAIYVNNGASNPIEGMRISGAGGVSIGTTTDPGAGNLLVAGNIFAGSIPVLTSYTGASTGLIMGTGIYGSMYGDDVSITTTCSLTNTEYAVGAGLSAGSLNGFTFSNSTLTCQIAGKYRVNWSATLYSVNNNEVVECGVMVGTTPQNNTPGSAECINGGKPVCVSGHGLLILAIGDVVKFYVENDTAAHSITMTHANMVIERMDS